MAGAESSCPSLIRAPTRTAYSFATTKQIHLFSSVADKERLERCTRVRIVFPNPPAQEEQFGPVPHSQPIDPSLKSLSHFCHKYRLFGRFCRFITIVPSTTYDSVHFMAWKMWLTPIKHKWDEWPPKWLLEVSGDRMIAVANKVRVSGSHMYLESMPSDALSCTRELA